MRLEPGRRPILCTITALVFALSPAALAGIALYTADTDAVRLDNSAPTAIVTTDDETIYFNGAYSGLKLPREGGATLTSIPPADFVYRVLLPPQALALQTGDYFALAWNAQGGPGTLLFGISAAPGNKFVVTSTISGSSPSSEFSAVLTNPIELKMTRSGTTLELAFNRGAGWQVSFSLNLTDVSGTNISSLLAEFGVAWQGQYGIGEIHLEGNQVPDVNQALTTYPPCGVSYGSSYDRGAIENAMFTGTAADVRAAIRLARETRGPAVGCPEESFARAVPNTTPRSSSTVRGVWNNVHAPRFTGYDAGCPTIGREWPTAALGAYYARLAGQQNVAGTVLAQIAENIEELQYTAARTAVPAPTWEGAFAYALALGVSGDPCYRGGIMDELPDVCSLLTDLCVPYTTGLWAGHTFLVGDFSTSPRVYDGGMAYDQGWSGVMLIETALQHPDPVVASRAMDSALLAGRWSAAEPCVRNHNYTAKNVWLLAQLYGLTGNAEFKAALLDKLYRNLLPGVLTDWDDDGLVDDMAHQPFGELWAAAQRPGRMWDGHNSLLWYQSMNTWAVTEAYVAFRDRGDTAEANLLRPYAIIMLDNMAWELCHLGPPATVGVSFHPIPYALLIGLWKVAAYEDDPHPDWEQAAWVLWNTGYPNMAHNRTTGNVGLYTLYTSGAPYEPLAARAGPVPTCPDCVPRSFVFFKAGSDACLRVPGELAPFTQFQWHKEGEDPLVEGRLHGVRCQTLLIEDLEMSDSGAYVCIYGPASNWYTAQISVTETLPIKTKWTIAFASMILLVCVGAMERNLRRKPGKETPVGGRAGR